MNNIFQMMTAIKQNPAGFLAQRGINIPQDISNDPNKITQFLMDNGKISQSQYNQAVRQAQMFRH